MNSSYLINIIAYNQNENQLLSLRLRLTSLTSPFNTNFIYPIISEASSFILLLFLKVEMTLYKRVIPPMRLNYSHFYT